MNVFLFVRPRGVQGEKSIGVARIVVRDIGRRGGTFVTCFFALLFVLLSHLL